EDSTSRTVNAATPGTFRTSYGFAETGGDTVTVRATIFVDEAHALVTATTTRTFDLTAYQQVLLPELLRSFAGAGRDTAYDDRHEADGLTKQMDRRLAGIRSELDQRVKFVSALPAPTQKSSHEDVGAIVTVMGDAASMVDALEFKPIESIPRHVMTPAIREAV